MKFITTGQTRSDAKRQWQIMVDDEDFEYLNQFYWQVDKYKTVRGSNLGKNSSRILLHRLLLNAPDNLEVDHIDGNRLNNQKSNLRLANSSQNKCNRGARKDNTSGYKGVSWHKQRNKWTARIKSLTIYKHLGLFDSKEDAAKAYNQAAIIYQGEFAHLNKI
jgi:hypothetical protein